MVQIPDNKPGFYYVTARRQNGDTVMLVGPFANDHPAALTMVSAAYLKACDVDPKAPWYAYGTVRSETDLGPGKLNEKVGFKADPAAVAA